MCEELWDCSLSTFHRETDVGYLSQAFEIAEAVARYFEHIMFSVESGTALRARLD
jgi:hypothetical protein